MDNKRNYNEEDVVKTLDKKSDIRIFGKQVQELKEGKGDVGNGSRGKIDFLVRYCGYTHVFVNSFNDYNRQGSGGKGRSRA